MAAGRALVKVIQSRKESDPDAVGGASGPIEGCPAPRGEAETP